MPNTLKKGWDPKAKVMQGPIDLPVVCPIVIGRTAELTALHAALDRAKSGKGQVALFSGEAGIGKSRLVAEAKTDATAQGFLLLQGQCFPTDRSCSYAPLLDLLRSHFATSSPEQVATEMGSLASALSSLLPDLLPLPSELPLLPPLAPEHEKRRLFAALAQLFLRQATKQPVLLIVEDLHWSDQTSLDFLYSLARRCAASALLVLLTYRSDEVHPSLAISWHTWTGNVSPRNSPSPPSRAVK
jgi:predicted ATPase